MLTKKKYERKIIRVLSSGSNRADDYAVIGLNEPLDEKEIEPFINLTYYALAKRVLKVNKVIVASHKVFKYCMPQTSDILASTRCSGEPGWRVHHLLLQLRGKEKHSICY